MNSNPRRRTGKVRVAVFGSFHGGCHVLRELLETCLSQHVTVVGVASDDPAKPYTHSHVRLWKYPHTVEEERLVPAVAQLHGLPLWTGRIRDPEFSRIFAQEWRPELCLMATFGQLIPRHLFSFPDLGFYNFHHSDAVWPSYPGPDPIAAMIRDGKTHAVITMHSVSEVLDGGAFFARSLPIPIWPARNAAELHRRSWRSTTPFIRGQVLRILASSRPVQPAPVAEATA